VKLNKGSDFIGKEALTSSDAFSDYTLVGFTSQGPIPRTGYQVFSEGEEVGTVSSGGRPPGYKKTIGLAWIKNQFISKTVDLMVREKAFPMEIVALPFNQK